jgi:hypothetical protein
MIEEELRPIPTKGWAAMIRKVYEVDPLRCKHLSSASATEKRISYLTAAIRRAFLAQPLNWFFPL